MPAAGGFSAGCRVSGRHWPEVAGLAEGRPAVAQGALAVLGRAAEAAFLIAPVGVKAPVKEPSVLATAHRPCQVPWKATTRPGGSRAGEPPARLSLVGDPSVVSEPPDRPMLVGDPSVVSQPCSLPLRLNEYTRPLSVHSFALPCSVLQPPWKAHPGRPPWAMTPPWRWVNSR
jgi:hypothetical protein